MGIKKKSNNHTVICALGSGHIHQSGVADPLNQELSNNEKIWQVVSMIPAGKVATYGQVARLAGIPSHARYVGTTLSRLPPQSRLPWHRVVNASLKISDRGGRSVARQRGQLEGEGVLFIGKRIADVHRWDT